MINLITIYTKWAALNVFKTVYLAQLCILAAVRNKNRGKRHFTEEYHHRLQLHRNAGLITAFIQGLTVCKIAF